MAAYRPYKPRALAIGGSPTTTGTINTPYSGFTPAASGGVRPFTFSLAEGALPSGMTLNSSTGALAGTPTQSGSFSSLIIRVTDFLGQTADLPAFTILVAAAALGYSLVGNRFHTAIGKSNTGQIGTVTRVIQRNYGPTFDTSKASLLWAYVLDDGLEHTLGNDGTVEFGIEYPLGTTIQRYTKSAATSWDVGDGTATVSDALTHTSVPNLAQFAIWTRAVGKTNGINGTDARFPSQNALKSSGGDCWRIGTSGALPPAMPTIFNSASPGLINNAPTSGGLNLVPSALIAQVGGRSAVMFGTSITSGLNENGSATQAQTAGSGDADMNFGMLGRCCGLAKIPYINMGRATTRAYDMQLPGNMNMRLDLLTKLNLDPTRTLLIQDHGRNDIPDFDNDQTQTWIDNVNNTTYAAVGLSNIQVSMTPITTSPVDAWTTISGQIIPPGVTTARRTEHNARAAAKAYAHQIGFFDLNAGARYSGSADKWRVGTTQNDTTGIAFTGDTAGHVSIAGAPYVAASAPDLGALFDSLGYTA